MYLPSSDDLMHVKPANPCDYFQSGFKGLHPATLGTYFNGMATFSLTAPVLDW